MVRSTFWDRSTEALVPPAPTGESYDDVVVGAGAVGLSVATTLAERGRSVLVIEAHEAVGHGTTARSTGKLALLQGTRLSTIANDAGLDAAGDYLAMCREALEWVHPVLERHDVATAVRPSASWGEDPGDIDATREEDAAARALGLGTRWQRSAPDGLPGHGAVVLDDELQVDALAYTVALAHEAMAAGVDISVGRRVTKVTGHPRAVVGCDDGSAVTATQVVLATGIPILDRSLAFATTKPVRSYALAFASPGAELTMSVSIGQAAISVRDAAGSGSTTSEAVVVGGLSHPVARGGSEAQRIETLRRWTREHLPAAGEELDAWSAQDYTTPDGRPLVGRLPGATPVHAVTGFGKWGLLAGVGAARRLAEAMVSGSDAGRLPAPRLAGPRRAATLTAWNGEVGATMVSGWLGAARHGSRPRATSTIDGCRRSVSGVCPHLGGVVRWNDAEETWDCPLHASRFGPDGRVLEGPSTSPLGD